MRAFLADTWRKIQPGLRALTGGAAFDAWLAQLRPMALERGILHLEAPNRLVAERVSRLFRDAIAESFGAELGTQVGVEVEPAPESLIPDELEVGPTQPVIDASNRTAVLILKALLERKPLPTTLILFHGGSGTGKTFLLNWWRNLRRERCLHFNGPGLVKAFQASMRDQRLSEFRDELQCDRVLVIDEVHRIAGLPRIQAELAKVLEVRSTQTQPTLMASRWHPGEIWNLDPGLETWLLWGLQARIEAPGPLARLAYLRALEGVASRNGRAPVIESLARDLGGTFPELRRAWAVERHGDGVRLPNSWGLIDPRAVFDPLLRRVAEKLEVDADEIVGQSQRRRVSAARKVLCWLCVQEGLSRAEVGRFLGRRTRAAISYAMKSLEAQMAKDDELRRSVEDLQ